MAGRIARRGAVLALGALWWWAVVRLVVSPGAGALEGLVAAGGWGLSLLPVHCVAKARAVGAVADGRWAAAWRGDAGGVEGGEGCEGDGGTGDVQECGDVGAAGDGRGRGSAGGTGGADGRGGGGS